jgi:diguanylate cyclase (GGDEF)-like protein
MLFGGRIFAICCAVLSICLASVFPIAPVAAATTELSPCFRLAQPNENVANIIQKPNGFKCTTHQNSMVAGDYWVRFDLSKSLHTANKGMVFRTASLWDQGIQLWTVHSDGQVHHYDSRTNGDINPMRLGSTVIVPIHANRHDITMIIAHVRQSAAMRGVMQQSQLATTEDALSFEMKLAALYAAFMGLSLALLVYNLALWRGMRQPFLLAYCAMALATLCYAFFTSGAPHYIWPAMTGTERLRFTIPLLAINAATVAIFIRHFFETATVPKWLVKLTYGYAATIPAYALIYAAAAPAYVKLMDIIYVASFVPLPIIAAIYAIVAYRQKDRFFRYFVIAWTAPIVAVVCRILYSMDILAYNILIENSTLAGLAIEALISSLAISRRVQMLAAARDRAEMAEANAMVIADTDALTLLPNRRAFVRRLLSEPCDWQLVLVDIDHFKRVNDTLGHVDGDEVLVRLAGIIRGYENDQSIVARLGGEEFAIATMISPAGTEAIAPEPLLAAIRNTEMPGGYRITASIGVARRIICEEMDWKILYRAADMALYRAKAQGRDRYVDYSAERAAA